jgi:hypothetical protein
VRLDGHPEMKLANDNVLTAIDRRYLGPPGKDFPWEVTYTGYAVGFVILVLLWIVEHKAGVPFGQPSIVFTGVAVHVLTKKVVAKVDHERPVLTVIASFWHELSAPRPPKGVSYKWKPVKVHVEVATLRSGTGRFSPAARSSAFSSP